MTPTLFVARVDGPRRIEGPRGYLSLHTSYEGAVAAVLRAGAALHRDRFSYVPEDLRPLTERAAQEYGFTHAAALRKAGDRLFAAAGWTASVEEVPVELDGPEEESRAEDPADAAVAEADATL
jgi:hypothetical protein